MVMNSCGKGPITKGWHRRKNRGLIMKGVLLYGIPIVIGILLHKFGFRTDAASAGKDKPTLHAENIDADPELRER